MKYLLFDRKTKTEKPISYEEAKERVSLYYAEKAYTYDEMLAVPGEIPMLFSDLKVEK